MYSIKIKLVSIIVALLSAITVSIVLFRIYDYRNARDNGFERNLGSSSPKIEKRINLGYPGYYFLGIHNENIFLSHVKAAAHIIKLNLRSGDTVHVNFYIPLDTLPDLNINNLKTNLAYPKLFFTDGSSGIQIIGNLSSKRLESSKKVPWRFDLYQQLSEKEFVLRTYDPEKDQNILVTQSPLEDSIITYFPETNLDGIFDIDGKLIYQKDQLFYMFFYKNKFIKFTGNLEPIYIKNTLDTISQPVIEITTNKDILTLQKPPLRVNKNIFVGSKYFFIESMIKSDNQRLHEFKENATIDRYDLETGTYINSFYLPKLNNHRATEYYIYKGQIIAIYDRELVFFEPL